ncbi:MAG: hypothetical protein H7288_06980 [Kineosporiaceae bacterium]|nr:hypothetical protein [Aeromicrobium sp.]
MSKAAPKVLPVSTMRLVKTVLSEIVQRLHGLDAVVSLIVNRELPRSNVAAVIGSLPATRRAVWSIFQFCT